MISNTDLDERRKIFTVKLSWLYNDIIICVSLPWRGAGQQGLINCPTGEHRAVACLTPERASSMFKIHWGRVTHICVGKLIITGSDNGLSPDRRQAIIWTNAGWLSIGPLLTYFSEHLIKIQQFSLEKMHMKMSSAKWRPSCLGLNVLTVRPTSSASLLYVYTCPRMVTSWHGHTFHMTGPMSGESTRHWCIPSQSPTLQSFDGAICFSLC